jgi:hypothetical protein
MPKKLETLLVFSPIVIGAAFLAYAAITTHVENSAKEAAAKSAGFASVDDHERAGRSGIVDGTTWAAKVKADAEKLAADEAQKKREWDAQAPEREARARAQAKAEADSAALVAEARRPPSERLSLSNQSWKTGGFDSIGLMTFTVSNDNPYPIKDFQISCSFYGNSGTMLGARTHTVYEVVKAKAKRTFSAVNIGFIPSQSARGGCSIEGAARS